MLYTVKQQHNTKDIHTILIISSSKAYPKHFPFNMRSLCFFTIFALHGLLAFGAPTIPNHTALKAKLKSQCQGVTAPACSDVNYIQSQLTAHLAAESVAHGRPARLPARRYWMCNYPPCRISDGANTAHVVTFNNLKYPSTAPQGSGVWVNIYDFGWLNNQDQGHLDEENYRIWTNSVPGYGFPNQYHLQAVIYTPSGRVYDVENVNINSLTDLEHRTDPSGNPHTWVPACLGPGINPNNPNQQIGWDLGPNCLSQTIAVAF